MGETTGMNKDKAEGLDRKVLFIIVVFTALAASILLINFYGNKVLSGARAYVAGEGHWTKAQKEATLHLVRYLHEGNEEDYSEFNEELKVNMGDKRARLTLMSSEPDYETAFQGFLQGNNHPQDIPNMIWLFKNFQNVSYIQKAINIWAEGDGKIAQLDSLAGVIHQAMQQGGITQESRNRYINELYSLDEDLTYLEKSFSASMGQAARWANNTIFWSTVILVTVLILIVGTTTVRTLESFKAVNRELDKAQRRFSNVLDNSRDVIYQMDVESGKYSFMSASVEDMIGYSSQEMLEKGPEFVVERMHPEDRKRMEEELEDIQAEDLGEHFRKHTEFRVKTRQGEYVWVSNKRKLLLDDNGRPAAVVGSVRDISERKEYEEKINESLREKETLLQEIHHRVKNNLAIISSLLELQKEGAGEVVKEVFNESQSRIQSIAMVHEKLYQSETLSDINMKEYIEDLHGVLSSAYDSDYKEVCTELKVEEVSLDISKAIPCGLIFNELINNVYKHAFINGEKGTLRIGFSEDETGISLSVADNGKGLPDTFSFEGTDSLGMTLVRTLTQQLGGEIKISRSGWTEFNICFNREV